MAHWLVKEEPEKSSFDDLSRDRKTTWSGVRNFQARNNLRAMQKDDLVIYYHSGKVKSAVGVAKVTGLPFPDPTAEKGDWSAVELRAVRALPQPVPLAAVRGDRVLAATALVKQTRLSVVPLQASEFERFLELGGS